MLVMLSVHLKISGHYPDGRSAWLKMGLPDGYAAFRWVSGESEIRSYNKPSGFRSDFCSVCGSPVPNSLRDSGMVWIPAGLLDEPVASRISVHLHTMSAAAWEQESAECVRLDGGPDSLESLNKLL
jgi:hypothetical protein